MSSFLSRLKLFLAAAQGGAAEEGEGERARLRPSPPAPPPAAGARAGGSEAEGPPSPCAPCDDARPPLAAIGGAASSMAPPALPASPPASSPAASSRGSFCTLRESQASTPQAALEAHEAAREDEALLAPHAPSPAALACVVCKVRFGVREALEAHGTQHAGLLAALAAHKLP